MKTVEEILDELYIHRDVTVYNTEKFKTVENNDFYRVTFTDKTEYRNPNQLEFDFNYK